MATFDFQSYLHNLDPRYTWRIIRLTGGLVNLTVRAERETCCSPGARLTRLITGNDEKEHHQSIDSSTVVNIGEYQSLILKYAPPFVASVGESAPFDQVRQKIETNALRLFSDVLMPIVPRPVLSIPAAIYHDESSHILILEDLGSLPPLLDFLSPPSSAAESLSLAAKLFSSQEACKHVGKSLGHFFACLHRKQTLDRIIDSFKDGSLTAFHNPNIRELIRKVAVSSVKGYMDRFYIPDSELLANIIERDFDRDDFYENEKCFTLGDLWPGGILIGGLGTVVSDIKIGVIDWEFAGIGRGVNGDMSQLLAHLHVYLIAWKSRIPQNGYLTAGLLSLIEAICLGYSQGIGCDSTSPPEVVSLPSLQIFRSALILHGREILPSRTIGIAFPTVTKVEIKWFDTWWK